MRLPRFLPRTARIVVFGAGLTAAVPASAAPGDVLEDRAGARIADQVAGNVIQAAGQIGRVAESRGVVVDPDILVGAGQGVWFAHAANVDAEDLRREELYTGTPVALTYLSLPEESGIPAGFYEMVARIDRRDDGTEAGVVQLVDRTGAVIVETAADVEMDGDYGGEPSRIKLDYATGPGYTGYSVHGGNWSVWVVFHYGPEGEP